MRSERFNGKLAVLGFLGIFCLTGCATTYALKPDFYHPTIQSNAKAHLTISILKHADALDVVEIVALGAPPIYSYNDAFDAALANELSTLFDHVTEGGQESSDLKVILKHDSSYTSCSVSTGVTNSFTGNVVFDNWEEGFGFTMEIRETKSDRLLWSYKGRVLTEAQEKQFWDVADDDIASRNPEEAQAILGKGISARIHEISEQLAAYHLGRYPLAPGEEKKGDSDLAVGKAHAAFSEYSRAVEDSFMFPDLNLRVKEKLLKLIPSIRQLPPIPDDARDHAGLGKQLLVQATDPFLIDKAVLEREFAIQAAPWWLDAYYNLAVTQAAVKRYQDAIDSMKLYLLGDADPADIQATKQIIYSYQAKLTAQGE